MKTSEPPQTLAERLREARESRGYTRAEIARALGVTRQTVHQWEEGRPDRGTTVDPRIPHLRQLRKLLRISLDWLIGED